MQLMVIELFNFNSIWKPVSIEKLQTKPKMWLNRVACVLVKSLRKLSDICVCIVLIDSHIQYL